MSKHLMQPSVLIVEDDDAIVSLLIFNLEKAGYSVRNTDNGEEALIMVQETIPDLIILDWMLPGLSGIQICQRLRQNEKTQKLPIIMLSARGEEADRIDGLECGVDDYLVKPFSPKELIARINTVFRRIRPAFSEKILTYGDIKMDITSHQVFCTDKEVRLGPVEYRLLQALMEYPNRVLSRDQLIRRIWEHSTEVDPRTVDVHINRLRKAIKSATLNTIVQTIRSSGYCLRNVNIHSPFKTEDL
jgi:two-component system phosphate regulon response regulator PhoB